MKLNNPSVDLQSVYNPDTGLFEDKTVTLNLGMN